MFNYEYVKQIKDEHLAGRKDNRKLLWNLMAFQMWGKSGYNIYMKKLNLGSGGYKKEGFINLDWNPLINPDVCA